MPISQREVNNFLALNFRNGVVEFLIVAAKSFELRKIFRNGRREFVGVGGEVGHIPLFEVDGAIDEFFVVGGGNGNFLQVSGKNFLLQIAADNYVAQNYIRAVNEEASEFGRIENSLQENYYGIGTRRAESLAAELDDCADVKIFQQRFACGDETFAVFVED